MESACTTACIIVAREGVSAWWFKMFTITVMGEMGLVSNGVWEGGCAVEGMRTASSALSLGLRRIREAEDPGEGGRRVAGGNSASSKGLLLCVLGVELAEEARRALLLFRCLSSSVCWAISIEESNDVRIELFERALAEGWSSGSEDSLGAEAVFRLNKFPMSALKEAGRQGEGGKGIGRWWPWAIEISRFKREGNKGKFEWVKSKRWMGMLKEKAKESILFEKGI
jgi:hypothetical protein